MDDDFKIIESPLSTSITQNGMAIEVHIYRGEKDNGWIWKSSTNSADRQSGMKSSLRTSKPSKR